jgi:hypothetical protein
VKAAIDRKLYSRKNDYIHGKPIKFPIEFGVTFFKCQLFF